MTWVRPRIPGISQRRLGDFLLFGVTSAELVLLSFLTPTFTIADWVYVLQHLLVLGIALTRRPPEVQDRSLLSSTAVVVSYAYPYAQVAYLRWVPGDPTWPEAGLVLVTFAGVPELRQPPQSGQMVRGLAGLAWPGNERSIPARAPSDVSGLCACRHWLQSPGMEFRHSATGGGGMGVPVLPHPCRRADTLSRFRMVELRCLGSPPPLPRPLVG